MKQPDKNKKITVQSLRKAQREQEQKWMEEEAQNKYNEGKSTTFNIGGMGNISDEENDLMRKLALLDQAESGSEMAIWELKNMGVDINVPDSDASGLTTWLFGGGAMKGGASAVKAMAMFAGKKGPKWSAAVKKMTDYYRNSGKKLPEWLANKVDDVIDYLPSTKVKVPGGPKQITGPTGKGVTNTPKQITGPGGPSPLAPKGKGWMNKMMTWAKNNPKKAAAIVGGAGSTIYNAGDMLYDYFTSEASDEVPENRPKVQYNPEVNYSDPNRDLKLGGLKYETGGEVLEGGTKEHVAGNLFEYKGRSHEDGGIVEGNIEVEGGEMEYQDMPMADGSTSDYIFSDTLKYGGATFAEAAKNKIQGGAGESDMRTLARIQESVAANKGEKGRDPGMLQLGGLKKMTNGGPQNLGEEGIAAMQKKQDSGYYASEDTQMISEEDQRKDFFERNKDLLVGLGIEKWEDYDPKKHAGMFQSAVNEHYKKQYENDPELQEKLKKDGIEDVDAYIAKSGFSGDSGPNQLDHMHGEYTNNITTQSATVEEKENVQDTIVDNKDEGGDDGVTVVDDDEEDEDEEPDYTPKQTDFGPVVAAAQMLPVFAAMGDKPNKMAQADVIAPGVIRAEREAKVNLDRVDYTDQMARNTQDAAALNRFIETSGGGSSNVINKMAVFAKKKAADRQIKSDETKANTAIGNQEATINTQVAARNTANALRASQTNAANILAANEANTKNKMYIDEFNRAADAATFDRKLDAMQTGVQNIAQMYRDRLTYDAEARKAAAIAGETGIDNREAADRMTLLYGSGNSKKKTTDG